MTRRDTDPQNTDFVAMRRQPNCIDHENRINVIETKVEKIDERQIQIFHAMFGPNGDPREGYVWKLERVLDWCAGFKRILWIAIPIGMAGSFAAIWQVFRAAILRGII